jgi:eukaryotic-like serine/threonine-protein kinase
MRPERWLQIEVLYNAALEREPESRGAFITEACHGDDELRAEVENLLRQDSSKLDHPAWEAFPTLIEDPTCTALTLGAQLGPYQIEALLGAGGMGQVYKARDTRLGRAVAVKICAAQFSERFEREARAIASLNHQNICHLYDVGPNFLVMELVEGENLAGPLPLETALNYARQIADALEAAHEKGIVHRDLKPANVKITPAGVVKVLDFGLALVAQASACDSVDPFVSPTLTMSPTRAGMILGTAPYMAPEQARGAVVDKRADIWAFGCVLYEMLTGKQTFSGDTMADVLASVMNQEPQWERVPARVRRLLRRCLEKDPRERLRDIGDAWELLGETEIAPPPGSRFGVAGWIVAVVLAVIAGVSPWALLRTAPQLAKTIRFQFPVPEKLTVAGSGSFSLSPNGSKLAYFARGADGTMRLWVRAMDSLESRPLPGTEVSGLVPQPPFWSPDSQWIVFDAYPKLKKTDSDGGTPQVLCDLTSDVVGGSWHRDGVILFGNVNGPVMRVPAAGGVASPVTTIDASLNEVYQLFPFLLPDGRHFLYLRISSVPENTGIYLGSLDVKPEHQGTRRLVASDYGALFVPSGNGKTGELLFLREGTLLSQPFDLGRLEPYGEPVPVAQEVGTFLAFGFFSASTNGALVYSRAGYRQQMTWFDREGRMLRTEGKAGNFFGPPALSPDGKQAVVAIHDRQSPSAKLSLWLLDFARGGTATRFTFAGPMNTDPVWSPDGGRIVFSSNRDGIYNLYWKLTGGAKDEEVLFKSDQHKYPLSWSRDGRYLLYEADTSKAKGELWILPDPWGVAGFRKPMLFQETVREASARFSPDRRWIAYTSDESGRDEVYVREFLLGPDGSKPEATAKRLISNGGGAAPSWRADGKELVYFSLDRKTVISVEIATDPVFRAARPKVLCQLPAAPAFSPAVTADAKRFLAAIPVQGNAQEPFTVVLNWTAGLKK